jgi:hypothetical protein
MIVSRLWGRIFILDFVYISGKFPSDSGFFPENEEISTPPPCGFLIRIYKFYKNWSTETFRNKESKKRAVCSTYLRVGQVGRTDDLQLPINPDLL